MALEKLGAEIEIEAGYVVARAKNGLRGAEINFPKVTVGGTHTALMAAALARGTTVIENAGARARDRRRRRLSQQDGRNVTAPASRIVVEGVARLHGARTPCCRTHRDWHYAMAVAMTGGDVLLQNARPELLQSALDVLTQAGATITPTNEGIASRATARAGPVEVTTAPFPGFPTTCRRN